MAIKSFGNTEILQVADAVAREKSIPRESILTALEDTIKVAARRKYGHEHSLIVKIDRKTGEVKLFREMLVVDDQVTQENPDIAFEEDVSSEIAKINLSDALAKDPDAAVGDYMYEQLPPLDLSRLTAQVAKNVIVSKVKELEREKQYEEFKGRIGEIVQGVVDKVEFGNVIVKLGSADAILNRGSLLKTDDYRQGDRVKAYLLDIDRNSYGPQIILSRTNKEFVMKLFAQEVPEIYDNLIEIKEVARDPGSRSKVAVYASDNSIDPVGSCVGIRGARVQAVINELKGEKIDILQWSSDPVKLVVNALAPIEVLKVIIDEYHNRIEVVVDESKQSSAIGRRGQNIKLVSELVEFNVMIMTEESETKRRQEEFNTITQLFITSLDLEEILAQLLAAEGYTSISELASATPQELMSIQGLDEIIANELIERAIEYEKTLEITNSSDENIENNGLEYLSSCFPESTVSELKNCGIDSLEELAELDNEELRVKLAKSGYDYDISVINQLIMTAREKSWETN